MQDVMSTPPFSKGEEHMTKDEIKDYWHEYIWAYAVPMTEVGVEKMNAHWDAFFEGWKHAELNIYKKDKITKDQYGNAEIPKWEPNMGENNE